MLKLRLRRQRWLARAGEARRSQCGKNHHPMPFLRRQTREREPLAAFFGPHIGKNSARARLLFWKFENYRLAPPRVTPVDRHVPGLSGWTTPAPGGCGDPFRGSGSRKRVVGGPIVRAILNGHPPGRCKPLLTAQPRPTIQRFR
jgi:hypothetical protein